MILELKPFKYDEAAGFYDKYELDHKLNRDMLEGLAKVLSRYEVNSIWDAACGTGAQSIPLQKSGFSLFSTDISAEMVAKARMKCDRILFEQADMKAFRTPEKVDATIVLMNSLGHLSKESTEASFKNISSNLHENGLLIGDVDNRHFLQRNLGNDFFVSRVCFDGEVKLIRKTRAVPVGDGVYEVTDVWIKGDEPFFLCTCEVQTWTKSEIEQVLSNCGYRVLEWYDRRFHTLNDHSDSFLFVAQKQ